PVLVFVDDFEAGDTGADVVVAYGDNAPPVGWAGGAGDWDVVRTLADVLGQWGGTSPSQGNHVVAAPSVATTPLAVMPGHYYTVAVDVAAANCAVPPVYDLSVVVDASEVPVASAGFSVCDRPA